MFVNTRLYYHAVCVFSVFVVLCSIIPLYAEPVVKEVTKKFKVVGKTAEEIRESMEENRPLTYKDNKHDAYTEWHVEWNFYWKPREDGTCYVYEVDTIVDVKHVLPKWKGYKKADLALKKKWDEYYKALMAHEQNHVQFGIKTVNEIEEELLKLNKSEVCSELQEKATLIGYEILQKYKAKEKEYDKKSEYGKKEGAVFH